MVRRVRGASEFAHLVSPCRTQAAAETKRLTGKYRVFSHKSGTGTANA